MTRDHADAYVAFLQSLTPARLPELSTYLAPQARFVDPFNDVTGREAVLRVFAKIFEDLTAVDFTARDLTCGDEVCFFAWSLRGCLRKSDRQIIFEGVTELRLDADGKIALHVDHWDAAGQLYAKFPILGLVLKRLRRRLSGG